MVVSSIHAGRNYHPMAAAIIGTIRFHNALRTSKKSVGSACDSF